MSFQKHLILIPLIIFSSLSIVDAQPYANGSLMEICNNEIDDDGDGLIDCYDPDCCPDAVCADFYYDDCLVDCEFTPDNSSFQMEEEWRYDAGNWHSYNTAITGDVDGDGVPEVIGKIGPFGNSNTDHKSILVINGQNGNLEATISTPTLKWAMDAVAIADINKNGYAEIIVIASNDDSNGANKGHIYCYEFDGTQYQQLWVSDISIDATLEILCWSPDIADFDGDGNAEVYVSHQIFNGLTGEFLTSGENNNRGVLNNYDIVAHTVAADVLPDNFCPNCSGLELIAGNQVYSIDDANTTMNVEVQATGSDDGFVGIADMDRDGDLDAVITYGTTPTTANVYIWDIQTPNQIGTTHSFPSSSNSEGAVVAQPNIADINNDGNLDIGVSGKFIYKFLTLNNGTLDEMWSFSTSDKSGRTGSTIFDFEGDGDKEIAYRDESQLRIFDANGATIFSSSCTSGTAFEYPVIVDVDADGETELLCSCNNQLVAYGSATTPWVPTRSVWNQHSYFNVNINDDLTVPLIQQQHHIVGDNMVLNNFLTQYSDLEFPVADATISIENADCNANEFTITITICNTGDNTLSFETPITFYDNNPTQASANPLITLTLGQSLAIDECLTQDYTIPALYNQDIYAIVNDDASLNPVFDLENDFPVTSIPECDFTNNIDNFIIPLNTPVLDMGEDITVCDAVNTTLNAGDDFETYEWQDGSTNSTFTTTDAGVYSVTVTDICGNEQSDMLTIIIEECCELEITATAFNIDCINEFGSITTMITDGMMPFFYLWNTGAETSNISNLPQGTYTVTVTDSENCTATATTEITSLLSELNISTNKDTLCPNESTNLTASGADYYEWTPADGLSAFDIPNPTATPNTTTTYTVTGYTRTENLILNGDFEQGNTGFTSDYNFNPNPLPFLPEGDYAITDSPTNVHVDFSDCNDHTTSTGNMMVVNGDIIANQTIWCQSVNVQPDTEYDFSTWVATAFPDAPAVLQFSINGDLLGAPFTASNTACIWTEFNEIWNSGSNTTAMICIVNQNTVQIGNDFALDDIAFSGVCTATENVTIHVSDINAEITDVSELTCNDAPCSGTATVQGSGGLIQNDYTYIWSDGQSNATATNLCADIYTVTVADDAGCEAIVMTEVTQDTTFTLQTTVLTEVNCEGACTGSASVTITGGTMPFIYTWSSGADTDTVTNLCVGTYTVTVTDANDCENAAEVEISSSSTLMLVSIDSTSVSCFGGNDGTATASATGGTPPYIYTWSNGETTDTISNLTAGTYSVLITDANGCALPSASTTVTEPSTSVSVDIEATDPTCNGLNNGTATALPEGGTPNYSYLWSNGSITETALNLSEGSYAVTITDANGCIATSATSLNGPTEITATISIDNVICFGDNTGSILIENVSGGLAPYTYSLDGEIYQMGNSFSGLTAGIYNVYVQGADGCVNVFDAVITQLSELLVDLGVDITIELSDSVQLFAQTNPTDPSLSYEWTPTNGLSCINCPDPVVNISDTETYTVRITDSNNCMATDDITINIDKNRNIFIPNVFSPNNDGDNDIFIIYGGKGVVGVLELKIYDRWGELIFENSNFSTDDFTMGWDGTFRGQSLNPQVFVYHAEIEFIDGVRIPYKGDITLIK